MVAVPGAPSSRPGPEQARAAVDSRRASRERLPAMALSNPLARGRALATTLALAPLLAACGGSDAGPVKSASAAPQARTPYLAAVRPPVRGQPPAARIQNLPGLEGVIGANAAELSRRFGAPRLDVWEGDARKLQFGSDACVLDVYLYPSAAGRDPQATYVDARRPSDGQDVDRASCIAALRRPG